MIIFLVLLLLLYLLIMDISLININPQQKKKIHNYDFSMAFIWPQNSGTWNGSLTDESTIGLRRNRRVPREEFQDHVKLSMRVNCVWFWKRTFCFDLSSSG